MSYGSKKSYGKSSSNGYKNGKRNSPSAKTGHFDEIEDEEVEAHRSESQKSDIVESIKGERGAKGALRELLVKWEGCGTHLTWELAHQMPKPLVDEWNGQKKDKETNSELTRFCMDNLEHTLYRALGRIADQEEITMDVPRAVFRVTFKHGKLDQDDRSEHKDWYIIKASQYLKWHSALPSRELRSGKIRIIDFPFFAKMSIRKAGPSVQETVVICLHKMEVDSIPPYYEAYTCGCY